jgi:PAS domain S-box-containing protein
MDGRNTYVSESFLNLVGMSQEQCSGFGWCDLLEPDIAERTLAAWNECVREERMWEAEHQFRGTDGQFHQILARGVPVRDDAGRIICWAGINLDITRLKEAESQIRQLNETLELRVALRTAELAKANATLLDQGQLLNLAHDMILVREVDGAITFWNTGAERVYGWTQEEAIGQVSHDLLRTKFPVPLEQIQAELEKKGYWDGELVHSQRDGTKLVVASRWALQTDERGQPRAYLEINNDITGRKHAEELLHRRTALLRSILDSMTDGVVVTDDDEKFLEFNPAAEQIFGGGPTSLKSDDWPVHYGLFLPDAVTPFPADQLPLPRAIRGEEVRNIEMFVRNERVPEGRFVTVNGRPLKNGAGERSGAVVVCRDISVRKRMEQDLSRSNAELEQFASIASHDLQEPLRMVSGFTQLLARRYKGGLDDEAMEYITFAVDGCRRMQGLIEDLLEFSRVGVKSGPTDLIASESVLASTLNDLTLTIAAVGAVITHDPLPAVVANSALLGRLFQNLIGNALKFHSGTQPRVHISAWCDGAICTFAVADNGIGIDSQHFDRIFTIFQRLHTRDEYVGTGIGLAVCKRIVEYHGGRIWVESQPGHGTTVHFTIPTVPLES